MSYITRFRNRIDLSEWAIHFVHVKIESDQEELAECAKLEGYEIDSRYPDYFEDGVPKYVLDEYVENEIVLEDGASGFQVLKKILHDGFIHSTWAYRNGKPTVYGPKSAVCFTEMPLYALIEYSKGRSEYSGYVGDYGIAFRRNELFAAGARPAIYGTSGNAIEVALDSNDKYQGRMLSEKHSGLLLSEQYRYVPTKLTKDPAQKNVDWMMEREWRWALPADKTGVPGIPFFLTREYADFFTEVFVIVSTDNELIEITEYLRTLYDSGSTNRGLDYNTKIIEATKVVSLESLSRLDNAAFIKLDTIPFKQIHLPPKYYLADQDFTNTKNEYVAAINIADKAIQNYIDTHPDFNEQLGSWGFVSVVAYDFTKHIQALKELGLAASYSDGKYHLGQMSTCHSMNLDLLEVGANAAAEYLKSKFDQKFYVTWRLD